MPSPPKFDVPPGAVSRVSVIDTTLRVPGIPAKIFTQPTVPGFDVLPEVTTWSFLVESSDGRRKVLFDLGVPKDRQKGFSPAMNARVPKQFDVRVDRDVTEILQENGVDPSEIEAIIWSHWHWDHIGDPSLFPKSVDLVVGPDFKKNLLPGYPTNPDSFMLDKYFEGRNLQEISFDDDMKAGQVPTYDYFGDGSFYLLNTPGHAIGHLGGLARTSSNPDTFIFMGADLCHHPGVMRPTRHLPYPVDASQLPSLIRAQLATCCPGSIGDFPAAFTELHTKFDRRPDEPLLEPAVYVDYDDSMETVRRVQEADAQENVWFVFAHDASLYGVVETFPKSANDWKEKGWKRDTFWSFLKDLTPATGR